MNNFIKTKDQKLADELRASGFKELKTQGKFFVFLNNGNRSFSADQEKKLLYTNKMEV
jgi:hypothetical protein